MKTTTLITFLCLASWSAAEPYDLNRSLQEAFKNRNAVEAGRLNVEQAQKKMSALGAYPGTELGIGYSSRAELGATDNDFYISQALDIFGKSSAQRKIGEAYVARAEAYLHEALIAVQGDVIVRYFEAATAFRLQESTIGVSEIAESLLQATQRRFEEGKIPEVQVTRAKLERDRALQISRLRQSQYRAALTRLKAAIGVTNDVEFVFEEDALTPVADGNLDNRYDLRLLRAELLEAEAEAAAARRSSMPDLELIGLRSPWRDDPTDFGARLQLSWTFNDFGKKKFELEAARKQAEAIRQKIADTRVIAAAELVAVQTELAAALDQITAFLSLIETNRILVQKTQLGFSQGVGTLIDVLEASRSLRELEEEVAEARLAANLATAKMYQTTGTLIEVGE
ncbi:MAG: TolC family protein [Fimbriimonadaceae bacterium]|nr:MAG: TolC family protein [Fimbriimonadaceae bacterium]